MSALCTLIHLLGLNFASYLDSSNSYKVRERVMYHENTVCFNIRLHIDIDIIVASACTTLFAYVLEDTYMDVCLSALSQYLHS